MSEGWAFVKLGDLSKAAARAGGASRPRQPSAVRLGLEVEIARSAAAGGLDFYERWLGRRTIEEPAALRRIAEGLLREEAAQMQEPGARLEALRGLADDGQRSGVVESTGAMPAGTPATRALAALGDEKAVTTLIARLSAASADVRTIDALGASGSAQAIGPIVELLGDPRQEVRGSAADALGRLRSPDVALRLMPLLSDRSAWVRAKAAGALYRLGDSSGLAVLQALAEDTAPGSKLLAAEALASRPDAAWIALVKELAASTNLEVRVAAARLIAPHDPQLARSTIEPLMGHENGAIRELASQSLGEILTSDLTLLRRLLRSPARLTRVRAAARVLAVTR